MMLVRDLINILQAFPPQTIVTLDDGKDVTDVKWDETYKFFRVIKIIGVKNGTE